MILRTEQVFTFESSSAEAILRAFSTASVTEPYGRARVRVSGKADRAKGFLRLRDTDTSLITFREKQLSLAQTSLLPTKKVQILETRGKETQLYNTTRVCLGLGGCRKHTLQDNSILQARISIVEGSSSTLGVDYTFGEVRPSLGRRRGPRISTLKDDVIITPGPRRQGLLRESGPSRRLGWSPRGLGQLSPEDISPARGLGRSTPASVPLTDDPARLRPTKSSFRANSASVRADTATPGFGSSKSSRGFI